MILKGNDFYSLFYVHVCFLHPGTHFVHVCFFIHRLDCVCCYKMFY